MNRKKKALLLASVASLVILSGCGSNIKESTKLQIDGETYVQNGDEYVKVDVGSKIFEPGTHVIHYISIPKTKMSAVSDSRINEGFDNADFAIEEIPEGYKLAGVTSYSNGDGKSYYIIYVLVNEKTVEAEGRYDEATNQVVYETPGSVVEEKVLEMGD